MSIPEDLTTKAAAARGIGRSPQQVDKWVKAGKIPVYKVKRGKRYLNLVSMSEVKAAFQQRDQSKSRKDDNGKSDGGDYWKWKAITEELKAQKMELELAVQRGELTDTARATRTVADLCRTITDAIYAAQDRLASHMDHKLAARVRREFDKAIETVSSSAEKAAEALAKTEG